jgi:DNA-binding transcriptional LysR family regulator
MRAAVKEIELNAAGNGNALEGTVRVTASVVVATYHLPKMIAALRVEEPQIAVELVPSDETSNLHYREADIAVRMYRPTQLDLVTQHLGELRIGAFASRGYLSRRGVPRSKEQLLEHDVIGLDRLPYIVDGFRRAGYEVDRDWFKVRCDDSPGYWALVKAGCGIGFGQAAIGTADPDLEEVPVDLELPTYPIWLTAHEAIRHTPRVKRVWDELAEGLKELVSGQ